MSTWFDGKYWSRYFDEAFVPRINTYCDVVINRVLATLANVEQEAEKVADSEFERLGNLPADLSSGGFDMADMADEANEAGLIYFEALNDTRQAMINLFAVGLYHLLEQQLTLFYRRQVLHPSEERKALKIADVIKGINDAGVYLGQFQSWTKIQELRFIANSVKHGDGNAVSNLRKLRPDIFEYPGMREIGLPALASSINVDMPLSGQDIYLTIKDIQTYHDALVEFWQEFGNEIRKLSTR